MTPTPDPTPAPPTVDYSKPVGWCCSRGFTWSSPRHHAEECWGDFPCASRLIPVYLPLPVPEATTSTASAPRDMKNTCATR